MTKADSGGIMEHFHELPLVGFSSLVTAGCGLGTAHGLLFLAGEGPLAMGRGTGSVAAVLLFAGILLSTGHLGRPERAPRALRRVGRSPLSNEVALVGATLGLLALSALVPEGGSFQSWLGGAFILISALTLLSLGWVYRLPGQLAWGEVGIVQPLVLGTAFGLVLGSLTTAASLTIPLWALLVLFLGIDLILFWLSLKRRTHAWALGRPVHPAIWERRAPLLIMRVLLTSLLPLAALFLGAAGLALLSISLGLLLDRTAFYGLAVRRDTDSEILRVEGVLRGLGDDVEETPTPPLVS